MKHSAKQKESGLTVLPNIALCEELGYLDVYSCYFGSALEEATQTLFEPGQKPFFGEQTFRKEDNICQQNSFIDNGSLSVGRTGRNTGRAEYPPAYKILKKHFESKRRLFP